MMASKMHAKEDQSPEYEQSNSSSNRNSRITAQAVQEVTQTPSPLPANKKAPSYYQESYYQHSAQWARQVKSSHNSSRDSKSVYSRKDKIRDWEDDDYF